MRFLLYKPLLRSGSGQTKASQRRHGESKLHDLVDNHVRHGKTTHVSHELPTPTKTDLPSDSCTEPRSRICSSLSSDPTPSRRHVVSLRDHG